MGDNNIFLVLFAGGVGIVIAYNAGVAWSVASLIGIPAILAAVTDWTESETSICKLMGGSTADCIDQVSVVFLGLLVGVVGTLIYRDSTKGEL